MATRSETSGLQMACWRLSRVVGLALVLLSSGCALCDSPYDYDFAAFGGVRDRYDRRNGRVGSILDPADAAGGTKTTAVERSFMPASGFRAEGQDYAASEYEPDPEAELPEPSKNGQGDSGTTTPEVPSEDGLGPPSEPAPDLPPPAQPESDPSSGMPRAPEIPAPPAFPATESPGGSAEGPEGTAQPLESPEDQAEEGTVQPPGELNLDELFPGDAQ